MTHQEIGYKLASHRLGQYITLHGMRVSMERQTLLRMFCSGRKKWAVAELVSEAEKEHICRATVYNALRVLTDAEIIRICSPAGTSRKTEYELCETGLNRIRMVCTKCGRQTELKDTGIARMVGEKKYRNFVMSRFDLTVYGECKVCRKKKATK